MQEKVNYTRYERISYWNRLEKFLELIGDKKYVLAGSGECSNKILGLLQVQGKTLPVGVFDDVNVGAKIGQFEVKTITELPENVEFILIASFEYEQKVRDKLHISLGERIGRHYVTSIGSFDRFRTKKVSKHPIIIVTVPKTGTAFIRSALEKSLDIDAHKISEGEWPNLMTSKLGLADCLNANGLTVDHLQNTAYNVDVLKFYGVKKIVVQVRDPRQIILSWLHHLEKIRAKTRFSPVFFNDPNYFDLEFSQKIDYLLKHQLSQFCDATMNWLTLESDSEIDVKVMTFNLLKSDPIQYFSEIYDFFGIEGFMKEIEPPKVGSANFRKGLENEWREVFSPEQADFATNMIPEALKLRFNWQ